MRRLPLHVLQRTAKKCTKIYQNYNRILESDWLSTGPICNGKWTEWSAIPGTNARMCNIRELFLPISKTSRIYFIRVSNSGETTIKRTQFSADD